MLKHAKLIGVVALGAAAAVTFVVIGTAGKAPTPATGFTGAQVSPSNTDVNCAAGAPTGTAGVQVKAKNPVPSGATLSSGRRIDVTWTGGSGSATIDKFGPFFKPTPGSTFPCPPLATGTIVTPFSFQLYNGPTPVGPAQTVNVTFHRVGSPS
jgi:hypothetical protein